MSKPKKSKVLIMYGKNAAKEVPEWYLGIIKWSPTRVEERITKDELARRGKTEPYIQKTKTGYISVCVYYNYDPSRKGGLIESPLTPEQEEYLYANGGKSLLMVGNIKPPAKEAEP